MTTTNSTSFVVYRWANPQTTSDYPFLAVAQDASALLSLFIAIPVGYLMSRRRFRAEACGPMAARQARSRT